MSKTKSKIQTLPNLTLQLRRTWVIFQHSFLDFLKIWLIGVFGLMLLLIGLGIVLVMIYGAWLVQAVSILPPWWLVALIGLVIGGYTLVVAVVNASVKASIIILGAQGKERNQDIFEIFKKGVKYSPALIILSIIHFFFFGSFWILIVPWVIIIFMAAFAQFEIVLEKQKPWQAIKNSFALVSEHTGAIIGRLLVVGIAGKVIITLYQELVKHMAGQLSAYIPDLTLFNWVSQPFVYVIVSWFLLTFSLVLYQDVKKQARKEKTVSTTWAVVLSALGWIFFITTTVFAVYAIVSHWLSLIDMIGNFISNIL